jgi:hypothetical protein
MTDDMLLFVVTSESNIALLLSRALVPSNDPYTIHYCALIVPGNLLCLIRPPILETTSLPAFLYVTLSYQRPNRLTKSTGKRPTSPHLSDRILHSSPRRCEVLRVVTQPRRQSHRSRALPHGPSRFVRGSFYNFLLHTIRP